MSTLSNLADAGKHDMTFLVFLDTFSNLPINLKKLDQNNRNLLHHIALTDEIGVLRAISIMYPEML